jgi:hypothetical protein
MTNITETLDELTSEVEYPPAWKPAEGETLAGVAIRWDHVTIERKDQEPRPCAVLVLRDAKGTQHGVWCWHTVLKNELVGNVNPGDFVAINYRGKRQKQSGDGEYDGYRVAIKKTETGEDIPF